MHSNVHPFWECILSNIQPQPPLAQLKTVSSHPVTEEEIGEKATAQVAEEVMMIAVMYQAFVQLLLMEVSTCKGTALCSCGLELWVVKSIKPFCSFPVADALVYQSIKSVAKAHSSLLSGAVLRDSRVLGIRTDPKWTAGRKQSAWDWMLTNMIAMVSQYILHPDIGGIWAIMRVCESMRKFVWQYN